MAEYGVTFEGALVLAAQFTAIKLEVLEKEIKDESDLGV
jgi:hypothetical protein